MGDDRPNWRPDHFDYELWGTKVGIEFARVKLLDYAVPDLEKNPNPFAVLVLAHLRALETAQDDEARRASVVRVVKGLYTRGFDAEQVRQLYRLIDTMMNLQTEMREVNPQISRLQAPPRTPRVERPTTSNPPTNK